MTTQEITVRIAKTIPDLPSGADQYTKPEPLTAEVIITETCPKKKYGERLDELLDLASEKVFGYLESGEDVAEGGKIQADGGEGDELLEEGGFLSEEGEEGFEGGEEGQSKEGFESDEEGGEEGGEEGQGEEGFEADEGSEFEDFFDDDDPGATEE
jgi:hypothetical protein